jgi:hypothetical protein
VNCPYSINDVEIKVLQRLVPGVEVPTGISPSLLTNLIHANIVVPNGYEVQRESECSAQIERARREFRADGYSVLTDLLPPLPFAATRRYYRDLVTEGFLQFGDRQVERRYIAHNEDLASLWHVQFADIVSRVAAEPVIPSYSYFAKYEEGAILGKHRDRSQCEFSISFLIDYTHEPPSLVPWPLLIERRDQSVVAVRGRIGDGILYRGHELAHWRDVLPNGHSATALFLHYVRPDFKGSLS